MVANAQRHGADRVVVDDLEARRCAAALGLRVIGTLGVVARAKRMGRIELAAPTIDRLRKTGLYVSEELVERILREVGENRRRRGILEMDHMAARDSFVLTGFCSRNGKHRTLSDMSDWSVRYLDVSQQGANPSE